jgi:hypothetical protein
MKLNTTIIGILAGLAVVAYTFALYSFQPNSLFTGSFYFSSLLIYAVFMYWAAAKAAKTSFATPVLTNNPADETEKPEENEGDFRGTLRAAFGVFLLANACYYAFDYWLYNSFDPLMQKMQAEAAIEMYRATTPIAEMDKLADNIRTATIHNVKSLLTQFGKGAIGGFGLSVILTFFALRNNKPR